MGRLIKFLVAAAVLGFVALTAYAYLALPSPVTHEVTLPVSLHAD